MSRSRGYCFTLNNWTDVHVAQLILMCDETWLTYLVVGFEVGPKNGVPHLQGYMHFDNGKTMRHICNLVDNISLQEAKATGENFDRRYLYCMKDGDFWEYGERPQNGVNTTSAKVMTAIKEGKTIEELYELFPSYMLHHSTKVKQYVLDIKPKQKPKLYVLKEGITMQSNIQDVLFEFPDAQLACVTELNQLESYEPDTYDTVVYFVTITKRYIHCGDMELLYPINTAIRLRL